MNYYIGMDLGTSALKAMLLDEEGKIIKETSVSYPLYSPMSGYSEQNPEDWYKATIKALKILLKGKEKKTLRGIGLAGQMHGLVLLDKEDSVLRNAILWNDSRSQKEVDELNKDKGYLFKNTGNIAFAGFTLPKLLWVRNNEKEIYQKIDKVLLPKDYIVYLLTGQFVTERSDASGSLFYDLKKKEWNKEILDSLDLKINNFPKILKSEDVVGTLKEEIKEELGLSQDVYLIAGQADNAGSALSSGVLEEGMMNLSLGTSGTLLLPLSNYFDNRIEGIHNFAFYGENYLLLACILSCCSTNDWWLENILENKNFEEEYRFSKKDLLSSSVLFLPYLVGERSPINDSKVRSVFYNLDRNTTRKEMSLAVLEGISFAFKDCYQEMKKTGIVVKKARVSGGGSRLETWLIMLASMLNMDIELLEKNQGASYGTGLLTIAALEKIPLKKLLKKTVTIKKTYKPREDLVKKYDEKFVQYKKLYTSIKEIH